MGITSTFFPVVLVNSFCHWRTKDWVDVRMITPFGNNIKEIGKNVKGEKN